MNRRAITRSQLLRASASLSPLPPAMYKQFSTDLAQGLSEGKWLKPKSESEEAGDVNPFGAAGMDTAMDGMKKQGLMMYVLYFYPIIRTKRNVTRKLIDD